MAWLLNYAETPGSACTVLEHLGGRWAAGWRRHLSFGSSLKETIDEISLSCISASMLDSNWPTQLATTPSKTSSLLPSRAIFLAPHEIKGCLLC